MRGARSRDDRTIGRVHLTSQPNFADMHVLVVDDEAFIRALVRQILEMIGVGEVSEAADGTDALTKLDSIEPDLVILDILMEPMNGLQVLKAIRVGMSPGRRDLPVIVFTESTDQAVMGTAMALDCDAFLLKSDEPKTVQERITRVMSTPQPPNDATAYSAVALPDLGQRRAPPRPARQGSYSPDALECPCHDAEVGDVLDQELLTPEGHLLLPAGTVLTESSLNRLHDISEMVELPPLRLRRP
jgi:two-component system chemotaxis response regulator CheY